MTVSGVVHGRTIELAEDVGLEEGQQVQITIRVVSLPQGTGDGIRRTAGALADDPHWDGIMSDIQDARRKERRVQGTDE
jgi:hypothetical protein